MKARKAMAFLDKPYPLINLCYYTIAEGKYKLLFPEKDTGFARISRFQQFLYILFVQHVPNRKRASEGQFRSF